MPNHFALPTESPPVAPVQQALHEGRTVDAADMLAQWVQTQAPDLTMEQQAHLLHGCHDAVLREHTVHPGLWQQVHRCLSAARR